MNNLIIYSLEVAVSIALLYTVYWMFLKNETYFMLNRFYLVSSVLLSLLLPLLSITIEGNSFLIKTFVDPIEYYEQELVGSAVVNVRPSDNIETQNKTIGTTARTTEVDPAVTHRGSQKNHAEITADKTPVNWLKVVLLIYLIGVGLFFIRFVASLVWIYSLILKHRPQEIQGMQVIRVSENVSPFSFLHFIVIGQTDYHDDELNRIISHEKVHIRQRHSMDLFFFELLVMFQWFNPFIWFYRRAIKITHEYLADEGTLNEGVDMPAYQYSLLNQALSEHDFKLTNNYNLSLKKRIAMMMQKRSSRLSALKPALALPILLIIFSAFAFNPDDNVKEPENAAVIPTDSIKEVKVPVAYLKSLEGEYNSTNEPNRKRQIIFTELLGYLYGVDAHYAYKIVPLGSESFINPDDKAPLLFNSTDKNSISLLLFGKVTLKKKYVAGGGKDVQTRAMAFTLANVMLKKGVTAGLGFFNAAKDSANYFISENHFNYAGYVLWQTKHVKEAEAMFKLNTELYPNSFNTYDSYAELLLETGNKNAAIDYFKKSVELNPGSKNGLQRLKELGVNTENLVKTAEVPVSYLKMIEGDYLSTNEKNRVRWIRLSLENGVLYGTDNGYRYRLIPMGNGRFINPDDGAALVFDTKDERAISLNLFGTINLQKVKTVKESDVDLNKYTGLYNPEQTDVTQKPTQVIIRDNKLVRIIVSDPEGPNKSIKMDLVTDNTFFYTDHSGRSLQFIVNDKNVVTEVRLRRPDGVYRLIKQ